MAKIKRAGHIFCFFVLSLLYCHPCFGDPLFVDVAWLSQHQKSVIILDARPYRNYFWSHIPGALSAPWKTFSQQSMEMGDTGWGQLLPEKDLAEEIGALGIENKSQVVVYGNYPGWGDDGRVAWTLQLAGVENVHILDGGLDAWESMKRSVTMKESKAQKSDFIVSWNKELEISLEEIIADENLVLIDTRTKEEFEGAINFDEVRGGHLPGAIHLPFTELFTDDGHLKGKDALEALFTAYDLAKTDKIVTYCTAGIRSAHMTLVLRSLGYDFATNYDAGFYEWAERLDLPLL